MCVIELAILSTPAAAELDFAKRLVLAFYEALAAGDADKVQSLVTSDLEWWFHGPASERHLMRLLTGAIAPKGAFCFQPLDVCVVANRVCVEGEAEAKHDSKAGDHGGDPHRRCWVHVWTIKGGKLTQLREYFDTELTILIPASYNAKQPIPFCATLWQSQLWKKTTKQWPSLILVL